MLINVALWFTKHAAKIAGVEPAEALLRAAGYVLIPGDPDGDGDATRDRLHPSHRNLAAFELVLAEVEKA